ncbi:hypothetical protein TWF694_002179 [Orbilia ellipsospora]|uniref:N-acetyltransferase domain-containing protein n=1 Tax=Orbilia ellipsospora TaxID=2528407 RepID=A0AAV9X543_9PEZI
MGFSLQQVEDGDVAELVRVHSRAFKTDQFSNFMLSGKPPGTHESLMERSIRAWLSDPTVWMVKAVNDDDGAVVGWVCWLTKTMDKATTQARPETKGKSPPNVETQPDNTTESRPPPSQEVTPDAPTRVVSRQMRQDTMRWEEDSMTENTYLVLQGLATSPEYQCQGIGSQLVKWGVDRADTSELACWCHASPAGNQLYLKAGFQELGSSEYDLGDFGKYTFRYMVRRAA